MTLFRRIALAAALAGASASALADKVVTYAIDPTHTQVVFSWNHLGFSTPAAVFREVTGTIEGNQDNPEKSTVSVTLPVKSLDSFVPALNDHLVASGEYFKAKEHPYVTFKSTALRDINRDAGTFKLAGNLTVNGITREVVLDARVNKTGAHPMPFYKGAEAAGFNATTTVKRSDFGMNQHVPYVSDELDVKITVEAIEAGAFQAAMDEQKKAAAAKARADKAKASADKASGKDKKAR